jgi:hypothetical protein
MRRARNSNPRRRALTGLALRVGLFYPFAFVSVPAGLSVLLAALGSDLASGGITFRAVLLAALASLSFGVWSALTHKLSASWRVILVALSLLGTAVALGVGMVVWVAGAEIACGDRYECPF